MTFNILVDGSIRVDQIYEMDRIETFIKNRIPIGSSCAYSSLVNELVKSKVHARIL